MGTVLDALETSNQASSTVVALFSDHGWKLGEFGLWGKHTALHADIHVPLMVRKVVVIRVVRSIWSQLES